MNLALFDSNAHYVHYKGERRMDFKSWIPKFKKYKGNPVIQPGDFKIGGKGIYNPSVIVKDDVFYLFSRYEEHDDVVTGRIAMAISMDGIHFSNMCCVLEPEFPYESKGCEDPRVVEIDGVYYMTYVGNSDKQKGHVCLARSKNLYEWEKLGVTFEPQPEAWDNDQIKAGVLLPERFKNQFVMYFLGQREPWKTAIGIAYSEDLKVWREDERNPILLPRKGFFDSKGVEPGPTPLIVEEGILFMYNGWDENHVHRTGAALLSKEDPAQVIDRLDKPLLEPQTPWEREGVTRNVVFTEGLVVFKDIYYAYYGAADKCTCLALENKNGR